MLNGRINTEIYAVGAKPRSQRHSRNGFPKRSEENLQKERKAGMNKVILMGRLTKEPEVRYSDGAEPLAVARYTLAVSRRFKKDEADFIPCVAFGKAGEFAEKYFKKGQLVAITGRLQVRSWDKDGERRWSTEVIIEERHFAEGKHDSEKNGGSKPAPEQNRPAAAQSKPAAQTGKQMGLAEQEGFYPIEEGVEDDDLPF